MSDKQRYIIKIIEQNSKHRFEGSGLSAYEFIGKHMDVYSHYKELMSVRIGMARLCGLSIGGYDEDIAPFEGNDPMGFRN